jgi:hypothetical protein
MNSAFMQYEVRFSAATTPRRVIHAFRPDMGGASVTEV